MDRNGQPRPSLRWGWIALLGLSGLVFGLLTISGAIQGIEGRIILAILVGCAVALTFVTDHSPIRHGFATGLLLGLLGVWSQALFIDTYFRNNPDYAEIQIPFGMPAQLFVAAIGPLNALLAGAIVAALTWVLSRLRGSMRRYGTNGVSS